MVKLMRECKAPLLAGGGSEGLIAELEALVDAAGFSPQEALRSATVEAARFLGRADQLGSVAPGRFADLVVLDANPLQEVSNLRSVSAVVVRGRWLSREALAGLRRPAR
jgi:imidazolonepropionase-like amidohydrolase